jgi:hypothetical protein
VPLDVQPLENRIAAPSPKNSRHSCDFLRKAFTGTLDDANFDMTISVVLWQNKGARDTLLCTSLFTMIKPVKAKSFQLQPFTDGNICSSPYRRKSLPNVGAPNNKKSQSTITLDYEPETGKSTELNSDYSQCVGVDIEEA